MIFNKKRFIHGLFIVMVALMVIGTGLLAGCTIKGTNNDSEDIRVNNYSNDDMSDFNALLEGNPKVDAAIKFIDENISKLQKEDASLMLFKLEELQKRNCQSWKKSTILKIFSLNCKRHLRLTTI